MAEILKFWERHWEVQLVAWGAILAILLVAGYFLVRRLRDSTTGSVADPQTLLTNFREMRLQGDISDKEFRTINSLLNAKQAPQINHSQDST